MEFPQGSLKIPPEVFQRSPQGSPPGSPRVRPRIPARVRGSPRGILRSSPPSRVPQGLPKGPPKGPPEDTPKGLPKGFPQGSPKGPPQGPSQRVRPKVPSVCLVIMWRRARAEGPSTLYTTLRGSSWGCPKTKTMGSSGSRWALSLFLTCVDVLSAIIYPRFGSMCTKSSHLDGGSDIVYVHKRLRCQTLV